MDIPKDIKCEIYKNVTEWDEIKRILSEYLISKKIKPNGNTTKKLQILLSCIIRIEKFSHTTKNTNLLLDNADLFPNWMSLCFA